jgi:hypothetical protein
LSVVAVSFGRNYVAHNGEEEDSEGDEESLHFVVKGCVEAAVLIGSIKTMIILIDRLSKIEEIALFAVECWIQQIK